MEGAGGRGLAGQRCGSWSLAGRCGVLQGIAQNVFSVFCCCVGLCNGRLCALERLLPFAVGLRWAALEERWVGSPGRAGCCGLPLHPSFRGAFHRGQRGT